MLNEYPEIEVVQIQLNYIDFEDPAVQARLCYEVCRKHNKPVIVMEPVKGGNSPTFPSRARLYSTLFTAAARRATRYATQRISTAYSWCSPA